MSTNSFSMRMFAAQQEAMLVALEMAWVNEFSSNMSYESVIIERRLTHNCQRFLQVLQLPAIQSPNKLLMLNDPKRATTRVTRLGGVPACDGCTQGCTSRFSSGSVNPRAVEVPWRRWLPPRFADENIYKDPQLHITSSKSLPFIFFPSMLPTRLLVSFLAVLPVSLVCLSLNSRIYINEFVQFISATPSPVEPASLAEPTFVDIVQLNTGINYTRKGCRR